MADMSTTADSPDSHADSTPASLDALTVEEFVAFMPEGMGRLNE